ncbi:MAG: ABC transporter permease [Streptococcus sp.]|nr:ABC transporter permease [Streptococcus sp.]
MFKRIQALLWLRFQIIFSNKSLLLQILMPFAFAYFYKYILNMQGGGGKQQALTLLAICLPLSLAMAVGNPITLILSEEKEKHNLRTLLVSGVKGYEYIVSTLILPIFFSLIIMVAVPLILGVSIHYFVQYAFIVFSTSIVIILLYLFLGLVTRNQVDAQVISVPAMLIISFLPMIANFDKNLAKFSDYSFMGLFTQFVTKWEKFSWGDALIPSISLAAWILLLIICNSFIIKKRNTI